MNDRFIYRALDHKNYVSGDFMKTNLPIPTTSDKKHIKIGNIKYKMTKYSCQEYLIPSIDHKSSEYIYVCMFNNVFFAQTNSVAELPTC